MIITFSTTIKLAQSQGKLDPLLSGIKTVTRRKWKPSHAEAWLSNWENTHKAYNKAAFLQGEQIGTIKLTCKPYQERLKDMPEEDLIKEGDLWESTEEYFECIKCNENDFVWVVRFTFEAL